MLFVLFLCFSIASLALADGDHSMPRHINHEFRNRNYHGLRYCHANPALQNFNKSEIFRLEHNEWYEWDVSPLSRIMIAARHFAFGNDFYLSKKFAVSEYTRDLCGDHAAYIKEAMDLIAYPPNAIAPCPTPMKMFGNNDDTGKYICEADKQLSVDNCVIFSLGSNNQFDFEEAIAPAYPNCTVYTFDCTSNPPTKHTPNVVFKKWCLGAKDQVIEGRQFYTIQTIMNLVNVTHVQYFKMDIEGYEMDVFDALLVPPYPSSLPFQLSFETHFWHASTFTGMFHQALFQQLLIAGYRPVLKINNGLCMSCNEHVFVRVFC